MKTNCIREEDFIPNIEGPVAVNANKRLTMIVKKEVEEDGLRLQISLTFIFGIRIRFCFTKRWA